MTTDTAVEKELTQREERFCVEYYRTGEGTQSAITARYSPKSAAAIASQLLKKPHIIERIRRLRAMEVKLAIADVDERKGLLTEVYRFPLPDRVSAKERVMAIGEHNKMDGVYTEGVHIDNRTIEIIVSSETAKKLTERIIKGEGT